jgi:Subtilase family
MVDIVSLSLGAYDESSTGNPLPKMTKNIDELRSLGVLVVAAAGNDSTTRRFYPAALAARTQSGKNDLPVVSVGALNPNGTKAIFSNDSSWVHNWQPGVAIVSAYPPDVNGGRAPYRAVPTMQREALDEDDFSSGLAVWDGTSFAAPLAAAELATIMLRNDPTLPYTKNATIKRAGDARKGLLK